MRAPKARALPLGDAPPKLSYPRLVWSVKCVKQAKPGLWHLYRDGTLGVFAQTFRQELFSAALPLNESDHRKRALIVLLQLDEAQSYILAVRNLISVVDQ